MVPNMFLTKETSCEQGLMRLRLADPYLTLIAATTLLMRRSKTTGVVDLQFSMDQVPFRVTDVGGQRTERKKWIHYFQDVTAVLYVAALSEFNQVR